MTIVTIGADMGAAADRPGRRGHRLADQHYGAEGAGADQRVEMSPVGYRRASLYALPYYATAETMKTKRPEVLAKYPDAPPRKRLGLCPCDNQREGGRTSWWKEYPQSGRVPTRSMRSKIMLSICLRREDQDRGLRHHGPGGLAGADRALCLELGQFTKRVAEAGGGRSRMDILKATEAARPRIKLRRWPRSPRWSHDTPMSRRPRLDRRSPGAISRSAS